MNLSQSKLTPAERFFCPVCGTYVNGPETRHCGTRPERDVLTPRQPVVDGDFPVSTEAQGPSVEQARGPHDSPTIRCYCEDEFDVIGCPVHDPEIGVRRRP